MAKTLRRRCEEGFAKELLSRGFKNRYLFLVKCIVGFYILEDYLFTPHFESTLPPKLETRNLNSENGENVGH